ncbi:zinc ribbon domain-containing protein [Parasulfuritortus cantonensis]|uniref:Zinc ribbon domain-containing protein n=1 Tax=Parasulfuritortus cantonensis TaxID=2528202 RepID=A0A4R1B2F0_9PROT|nr:zinc ribbon domain-containing protein [Parasulfuritortus cantonensis]TCJ11620.1 zinc ribbon domain-containing protein [Parasulfuritortus cantonensis]
MELVFCMQCGQKIPTSAQNCPHCGAQQTLAAASTSVPPQAASLSASALPEGIKGWSWGAFWLSWVWAIFNKTWIGLLALIPLVNLVMMVILGLKGREWAWRNKAWPSVEHFNRVQKKWSLAGWIIMVASLILGIAIGVIEDRMKQGSNSELDTSWSLEENAGQQTPAAQLEPANAPAVAPYPMPSVSFGKVDLLGAMKRAGMEQHWITHFTNYLSDPISFWDECVTSEAGRAQHFGNMNQMEAQAYGESTCKSLTQQHYACLNGNNLDDAVLCLQTHINNVAENGE